MKSEGRIKDQFYTKPSIAKECLAILETHISIYNFDIILEPSAGYGSFFLILPKDTRVGLDIDPKHPEIFKEDYLYWWPDLTKKYVVIGNPPFGKNSSLALKFFNKSAEFCDVIAFILPKTFKKVSMINKLNEYFHLTCEQDLPKYSFEFEGNEYDVPTCFQIWIKKDFKREKVIILRGHSDFNIVNKAEEHDFAIQRVGGRAGKIKIEDRMSFSNSSHYFIKSNIDLNLLLERFKEIDFTRYKYNTAGNPSVSANEIYSLYNDICNEYKF